MAKILWQIKLSRGDQCPRILVKTLPFRAIIYLAICLYLPEKQLFLEILCSKQKHVPAITIVFQFILWTKILQSLIKANLNLNILEVYLKFSKTIN